MVAIAFRAFNNEEITGGCSIIQGSRTTDPFAAEWSFQRSTGGPVYVKCDENLRRVPGRIVRGERRWSAGKKEQPPIHPLGVAEEIRAPTRTFRETIGETVDSSSRPFLHRFSPRSFRFSSHALRLILRFVNVHARRACKKDKIINHDRYSAAANPAPL